MIIRKNIINSRNKVWNCLESLLALSFVLGGCNSIDSSEKYSARQEQNLEENNYRRTFMEIDNRIIERIEGPGYSYNYGTWINNYGEEYPGSSYYAPRGWP